MNNHVAGLYIDDSSTIQSALAAGSLVTGWTAHEDLLHGDASIDANTTDSRLDLKPGIYLVFFEATVEAPGTSGSATSGDAQGEIVFQLYQGGTALDGAKSSIDDATVGSPEHVAITFPVEITEAQYEASTPTNYVDVRAAGVDSSGNDVLISQARLYAVRLS